MTVKPTMGGVSGAGAGALRKPIADSAGLGMTARRQTNRMIWQSDVQGLIDVAFRLAVSNEVDAHGQVAPLAAAAAAALEG